MRENEYDNQEFFSAYSQMQRSIRGLEGAGEWHELKKMIPELANKDVLDIGCGFGWHCKYAAENGANHIVGIDLSENMLEKANQINNAPNIEYKKCVIEDYAYPEQTFDVVISSLALHYIESYDEICKKIRKTLKENGFFIFSVEHPIFTANGAEDWEYTKEGAIKNWPMDHYFDERLIHSQFLGQQVVKYHKTLTTYLNGLIENGFTITKMIEPKPSKEMLIQIPELKEELRRPMMLLVSAKKN